eukprot:6822943-Ditylum_brightwellii.AAC.1
MESNTRITEIYALIRETTKATALKAINNTETMVSVRENIQYIEKGQIFNMHTSIQIPQSWLNKPNTITHGTILENSKHEIKWSHVDTSKEIIVTTFTVPQLIHTVDWGTDPIQSELILQCQYENEELNDLQQSSLKHCTKKEDSVIGEMLIKRLEKK